KHACIVGRYGSVDLPDIRLWNHHVLGKGAVGVDADDLYVLADMGFAGAALVTLAAGYVHLRGDKVAFLHCRYILAHSHYMPAKLMSGNKRRFDAILRPLVPVVYVQIGAAN